MITSSLNIVDQTVNYLYMDADSLIYHIKTDDFYKDIANDVSRLDLILVIFAMIDL